MEKVNGEMVYLLLVPLHLHCASHLWIHVLPSHVLYSHVLQPLTGKERREGGRRYISDARCQLPTRKLNWEADRKSEVAPAVTDFF